MGWDSYNVYILFGFKVPDEDIGRVLDIFGYSDINADKIRHLLPIFDKPYNIVSNGGYFISLKSIRFGVGDDDPYEGPVEVICPSIDEINQFKSYFQCYDINYPYGQYFLP